MSGYAERQSGAIAEAIAEDPITRRPVRAFAHYVWENGKAVPDTKGKLVHPEDYHYSPKEPSE